MIKYTQVQGLNMAGSNGLPAVPLTNEGRAIGAIPGWAVYADPVYKVGTGIRNRAAHRSHMLATASAAVFGTFSGGRSAVLTGPGVTENQALNVPVAFPLTEWTMFWMVEFASTNDAIRYVIRPDTTGGLTGYSPTMFYTSNGTLRVAKTDATVRLNDGAALVGGQPYLHMVTFSTTGGLKIYRNGVLTASAPSDLNAINEGYAANAYQIFRSPSSAVAQKFGEVGILSLDLSKAQNVGYRAAIETYLRAQYGFS